MGCPVAQRSAALAAWHCAVSGTPYYCRYRGRPEVPCAALHVISSRRPLPRPWTPSSQSRQFSLFHSPPAQPPGGNGRSRRPAEEASGFSIDFACCRCRCFSFPWACVCFRRLLSVERCKVSHCCCWPALFVAWLPILISHDISTSQLDRDFPLCPPCSTISSPQFILVLSTAPGIVLPRRSLCRLFPTLRAFAFALPRLA